MKNKLLIFGGSGHAKDVMAVARLMGYEEFQIVTTNGSCDLDGLEAIPEAQFSPKDFHDWDAFVAIGNNAHRKRFFEDYPKLQFVSLIAPSAVVSESATLAPGVFIGAHAYIGPDAKLGEGAIANTHAIVGHDSIIGDYAQVGPRTCIAGNVTVGKSVFIGAGAVINNGSPTKPLIIADEVTIGMACQVTASIEQAGARLIPKPNYIAVKD